MRGSQVGVQRGVDNRMRRGCDVVASARDVMWVLLVLRNQTFATMYAPYSMIALCVYVFCSHLVVAVLLL